MIIALKLAGVCVNKQIFEPISLCRIVLVVFVFLVFLAAQTAAATAQNEIELNEAERSWIAQKNTVRVHVQLWPPFMFIDGDVRGITIEYIKKIFDMHSISYSFIYDADVSWKQALDGIRDHRVVDMVPAVKITEDRKDYILFSDEYLQLPWVIFTRKDFQFVSSVDDLVGKKVCVQDGYVMHSLLKTGYPDIHLQVATGDNMTNQCLSQLSTGVVDGYIGNLAVGTYLILDKGYTNVKVAAPTLFGNHNQAMGVRNDWPELVSIINKTLRSFTPADHADIRNKWLSVRYEFGLRPRDIAKWLLVVASVALAIIALVLFWNRRLNKEIARRQLIEGKLRESEVRYRSLSDASFEGILILRGEKVVEVNKRIVEMSGYASDELVGKDILDLIPRDQKKKIKERLSSEEDRRYETVGLRKDGTTIPIEIQAKRFSYAGGEVRVAAVRDISYLKRTEEELKILRGILPLCSFCKKIRDDKGYWEQVDVYIHKHSEADISHGICPECVKKHYPDLMI
jgi:PAS domain S-box-containing protein